MSHISPHPTHATGREIPTRSNSVRIDNEQPAFICTICWQNQPSTAKPKILGSSARIVCDACWRAVLDLSICWVCGEYIVRGEEVVSLGWCFWHRGCFGCLVCGTRMGLPGCDGNAPNFREATSDQNMKGVELESAPLCGVCDIEMHGEEGHVIERGLETVSKFDGGISRDRMNMLEQKESGRLKHTESGRASRRRLRIDDGSLRPARDYDRRDSRPDDLHSLLDNAADMGVCTDGDADAREKTHLHNLSDEKALDSESDSGNNIYLSVLNPFVEPAFEPSKTKPLPRWMQLLPNNVQSERAKKAHVVHAQVTQHSEEAEVFRQSTASQVGDSMDNLRLDGPSPSSDSTIRAESTRTSTAPVPGTDIDQTILIEAKPLEGQRVEERSDGRSLTFESTYSTPPEYPSQLPPPSRRTPFPGPTRPFLVHPVSSSSSPSSYFPHTTSPAKPGKIITHHRTTSSSSEYLDKYHPQGSGGRPPSYTAKEPEPIIAKIRRQKINKLPGVQIAIDERRKGGNAKVEDEGYGGDPTQQDLHKELRSLFRKN